MIVAVHQPNYLPYVGFFHKMALADVLVLYDTAQFSKNDFHNRNRIKTPKGAAWLTVPVRKPGFRPIREVEVDAAKPWAGTHWRTIATNYARAPHFDALAADLEETYRRPWERLAPLNEALVRRLAAAFRIPTRIVRASDLGVPADRSPSERLADLTRRAGGDTYLSGIGGLEYLDAGAFGGLDLLLQRFVHPEYPQQWGPFEANLSALDLLLNVGDEAAAMLEGAGGAAPWPS